MNKEIFLQLDERFARNAHAQRGYRVRTKSNTTLLKLVDRTIKLEKKRNSLSSIP